MRSYRPVYLRENTIVVYPGIPAGVHLTNPYLGTPILHLLYGTSTIVPPWVTWTPSREGPLELIGTVHRTRCPIVETHFCNPPTSGVFDDGCQMWLHARRYIPYFSISLFFAS